MVKEIKWFIVAMLTLVFSSATFALSDLDPPGVTAFDSSLVLMPYLDLVAVDTAATDSIAFRIQNFPDMATALSLELEQTDYGIATYSRSYDLVSIDASDRHMRYEVGWQSKQH